MSIGSPRTKKYPIGTAELRVGPLSLANKLTQQHSVGLLDNVTIEVSQSSVDLLGGFPRKLVDTAIVSQESSLSATLREYSRRNLQLLMGEGVGSVEPTDTVTTLAEAALTDAVSISIPEGEEAGLSVGDLLVVYPDGVPEQVSVVKVETIAPAAASPTVIALHAGTPLLHDYAVGAKVYIAHQIAIGAVAQTKYFAATVLQRENSTGRPVGFSFWKAAISSGMTFGTNAEDFASTELQLKLLEPSAIEYASGQDLNHLASIIPDHPTGMYFGGGDA